MVKEGEMTTLSIPDHKEVAKGNTSIAPAILIPLDLDPFWHMMSYGTTP
jgi:hypothetical protein